MYLNTHGFIQNSQMGDNQVSLNIDIDFGTDFSHRGPYTHWISF